MFEIYNDNESCNRFKTDQHKRLSNALYRPAVN